MKKLPKKILALVMSLVLLTGASYGALQALAAVLEHVQVQEISFPNSASEGSDYIGYLKNTGYFWNTELKFMNGWSYGANPNGSLSLYINSWTDKHILYCIEIGVKHASNGIDLVGNEENFWESISNNLKTNGLTVERTRIMLSKILSKGYRGVISEKYSVIENADILGKALATQTLIREVIIGERSPNFEKITPPAGCLPVSYILSLGNSDLVKKARSFYSNMEQEIQRELAGTDISSLPSYASADASAVPTYDMVYADGVFTLTLTDTNRVDVPFEFTSSVEGVQLRKDGNRLHISFEDEFEGVANITLRASHVTKTGKIKVYYDGKGFGPNVGDDHRQTMLYYLDSEETEIREETVGYFNLNIPHVHRYAPFFVDPTCIHRGYTLWICKCGDSYANNYTDPLGHMFGPISIQKPGCVTAGETQYRCARCGAEYITTQPAAGHSEKVWVITTPASCTHDGEQTAFCTACGLALDTRPIPKMGHGKTVWKIDVEATAEHDGTMTPYCPVCGEAVGESKTFPLHDHKMGSTKTLLAATCTQSGRSGTICAICNGCYRVETVEPLGHTDAVSVRTLAPTCTQNGEKTDYCTRCGTIVSAQEVPAVGHTEGSWHTASAPTCTTDGKEVCTCSRCGMAYQSRAVDALLHDEGVWKTSQPATCTQQGEESLVCTRCESVINTRTIAELSHDAGVWSVTKAATCEENGEKICVCTRCGQKIGAQKIEALGHDSGVWKIDYEATADHNGQMSLYCSICKHILDTKPFSRHTHAEGYRQPILQATCTTAGEGGVYCGICGAVFETYPIDALGHDYACPYTNNDGTHSRSCTRCHHVTTHNCDYAVRVTAPTCTTAGYTTHTCTVCAYTYSDRYIEALGHCWQAWSRSEMCDCVHVRSCVRCAHTETAEHTWSDWRYNQDGSVVCSGTKSRICTDCGQIDTQSARHTSFIGRILYRAGLFLYNFFHKIFYAVSLNWLFPWMNITAKM